jgi:hypothetical protein
MGLNARVATLVLALACLAPAVAATADRATALADFNQGKQYQSARQWRQAIQCYSASLKSDPAFYYAYKALGTVYYQAGDHRGALSYYDLYLKSAPGDTATAAFAAKIRAEFGAAPVAALPQAGAPAQTAAPESRLPKVKGGGPVQALVPGFDVRAFAGGVLDSGSDLVADFPGAGASGCFAAGGGLGLDYGFGNGFVAGLDVMLGPNRSNGLTAGTASATATVNNMCAFLNAGWRFALLQNFVLEPRLGLGLVSGSLSISGVPDTFTGIGLGVWPELRAEYELGNWGLGLSAGYLSSNIPSLTDNTTNKIATNQNNSNVVLQTGGPSVGLFAVYHFDPLLK